MSSIQGSLLRLVIDGSEEVPEGVAQASMPQPKMPTSICGHFGSMCSGTPSQVSQFTRAIPCVSASVGPSKDAIIALDYMKTKPPTPWMRVPMQTL